MRAFAVWLGAVGLSPLAHPVLYLPHLTRQASPKAISGRTSYLQVRLAYHPYPQVIPHFCNSERFGPPRGTNPASACPWVAHLVSCLLPATRRPLRTRFPYGSGCLCLNLATVSNSLAHSPKGMPLGLLPEGSIALRLLVSVRFQVLFTPLAGVLFTFPSRYWSAIGQQEYLALGSGLPSFPPD